MDDLMRERYETKSNELRADLKKWEGDWALGHAGCKPGREDIKANPEIARKYKDYSRVRDVLSGRIPPPTRHDSRSQKRAPTAQPVETPKKRSRHMETPRKESRPDDDLMNTPAISRKLFSPTPVTTLGPTPQRDGKVLGLFDLLVERELGTPNRGTPTKILSVGRPAIAATPTKRKSASDTESTPRLGRTPMSSSKRQMLNTFMTPLKNRDNVMERTTTPSSVSKLQFDTPAFLKRHSMPTLDEHQSGLFDAPAPLRLPRKPMARGLSEIVASLRKVEDDHLDDDLDALREAENEGSMCNPALAAPNKTPGASESILTADTQALNLPLGGFDDEGLYDSADEEQLDRGQPLRLFKKKGQKRTTRRVKMKPIKTLRPEQDDTVPAATEGNVEDDYDSDPEVRASDVESDFEKKEAKAIKSTTRASRKTKEDGGTIKKAARKVNELAHANFQRLKLKNNGAKGGPGFNSRFRRRR